MVLGSRGYVFTLIISLMTLITLSLLFFQTTIYSPKYADSTSRISLNELHFYSESLKEDASRAISIAGQRGSSYIINHIILTNESFRYYSMQNCTSFNYSRVGVEAAIAEMVICGKLENAVNSADYLEDYMENNTIVSWMEKVNGMDDSGLPFNVTVKFVSMDMALVDSWHYVILSKFDIRVEDVVNGNVYLRQNTPILSIIDLTTLEDPMHYRMAGGQMPLKMRLFTPCEKRTWVNGSILDDWIESGCYIGEKNTMYAPSFFDRLENSTLLDPHRFFFDKYYLYEELGFLPEDIGLESLVNLAEMDEFNVSINGNVSQVDYYYWNNLESEQGKNCYVAGMKKHPDFRIDIKHAREYNVVGLNCHIVLGNSTPSDFYFSPSDLIIPLNTTVTFLETVGISHNLYELKTMPDGQELAAYDQMERIFNATGRYYVTDLENGAVLRLEVTPS